MNIQHLRDLTPDPANARRHNPRNVGMIERALNEVGAARSIVIDEHGVILAGNATIEAAAAAGIERVRVVDADGETIVAVRRSGLTNEQKKRLALYDNRTAELADWDELVLAQIAEQERALLDGLFNDDELAAMLDELSKATSSADRTADDAYQVERAAELQAKWQTAPGQLWQVGRHRVMCGDSSDPNQVAALLAGAACDGILTDPPYDLEPATASAILAQYADRAVVMCGGKLAFRLVRDDWRFCLDLVWKHRQPRSFATPYQPVMYHNNVVMLTRGSASLGWTRPDPGFGSVVEVDVVEYVDRDYGHGKCVEVFEELLRGFDWRRCADPFLGTGATLLACERRRVTCYGMERDPGILAVALERIKTSGLDCQKSTG